MHSLRSTLGYFRVSLREENRRLGAVECNGGGQARHRAFLRFSFEVDRDGCGQAGAIDKMREL
jgi:hypothetical protein